MGRRASYCLTEPGAGSDAAALKTQRRREGGDYILDGAEAVHLRRRRERHLYRDGAHGRSRAPRGISAFIVEKGHARSFVRRQ